jgi:Flp pilus assembly protein TadD
MKRQSNSPERRRWLAPLCGLGAVFLVKLIVFSQLRDHPLLQPGAGLDTTAYVDLARRVLAGDWGLGPGLYYVSPLYIYFLAVVYGLTQSFTAVHIVQLALGTATAGLVFVMAREWGTVRAGWIAATMVGGCGVLTFHEIVLMQSALDPFLTACALTSLTLALRWDEHTPTAGGVRPGWFLATGACFGIQALNRPQILLPVLVIVLLLAAARRAKPAVLVATGLVAAMLPVAARNVIVAGQWSLVSSHGGLNFYIGNHDSATGLYQLIPGIRPEIEGQREDTRRVAEAAAGRSLSDDEVSGYFFDRAWQWIREEPAAAVRLFGRKLALAVHADHVALPHSFEFFADDERTILRWLVVNPWMVFPLGLAGFLFTPSPRLRRASPPGVGLRPFWIWAAFVPAYAVALAVFFLAERYRLPLFIPLFVTAGMFLDRLLDRVAGPERLSFQQWMRVAGAVGVIAVVVNWPFRLADNREGDRLRMVQHAANRKDPVEAERWATVVLASPAASKQVEERIGRILLRAGHPQAALPHLRNAVANGGRGGELTADLAEALQGAGDTQAALATLQSTDWSGTATPILLRAGRLASTTGAKELAVTMFRRATEAEPASSDAWAQLGFALLFSDRVAEAESALQQAVRLKPADAVALGGLAVCAARLGRTGEALERANAALALDPLEPLARQVRAALARR